MCLYHLNLTKDILQECIGDMHAAEDKQVSKGHAGAGSSFVDFADVRELSGEQVIEVFLRARPYN